MNTDKIIEILKEFVTVYNDGRKPFLHILESELRPLATHIDSLYSEKVPDLSELDKIGKDEFIKEFVEMTAKNVLSAFVALGLKTHLEATVINDADGNTYKLSFRKAEFPPPPLEVTEEKIIKYLMDFYDFVEAGNNSDYGLDDAARSFIKTNKPYQITSLNSGSVSEEEMNLWHDFLAGRHADRQGKISHDIANFITKQYQSHPTPISEEEIKKAANAMSGYNAYPDSNNSVRDYQAFIEGAKWAITKGSQTAQSAQINEEIEKIISDTEDEHPYKEAGNRDSYSEYAEGWTDACDILGERIKVALSQGAKPISEEVVKIVDVLLQNPDILIDAVTNEMTDYDAKELVEYALKELNKQ